MTGHQRCTDVQFRPLQNDNAERRVDVDNVCVGDKPVFDFQPRGFGWAVSGARNSLMSRCVMMPFSP